MFLAVLIVSWEVGVYISQIPGYILPPPSEIFSALIKYHSLLLINAKFTLYETIGGFLLGVATGILLGTAIVYSRFLRNGLYPLIIGFQSVPKVAIAPLLIIWFGYGLISKVVMSFLIAFFPIIVSTISGLSDVDPNLIELLRSLSSSERQVFTKIRVPHSLPFIFDGFKISLPLAVIGAIVGEFVGANVGLGNLILAAGSSLNTPLTFATLLVVTLLSVGLFGIIVMIEKKIVWWRGL